MNKEIRKIVYPLAGESLSYRYHEKGFKTLLIKSGSLRITVNGNRFVMEKGDMVTFEPFCPYGYEVLSANTELREILTCFEEIDNCKELYEAANAEQKDKRDVFFVTGSGRGRHIFEYEGIRLMQKTARYQLGGIREIWEYQIDKGYTLSFEAAGHEEKLYFIESGKFQVKAGDKVYEKDKGDVEPISIPAGTPYQITALTDDCIIHNYNVKAHLFRLLEMLEAAADYFEEKLENKEYINELYEINKLENFIDFKKTADC